MFEEDLQFQSKKNLSDKNSEKNFNSQMTRIRRIYSTWKHTFPSRDVINLVKTSDVSLEKGGWLEYLKARIFPSLTRILLDIWKTRFLKKLFARLLHPASRTSYLPTSINVTRRVVLAFRQYAPLMKTAGRGLGVFVSWYRKRGTKGKCIKDPVLPVEIRILKIITPRVEELQPSTSNRLRYSYEEEQHYA